MGSCIQGDLFVGVLSFVTDRANIKQTQKALFEPRYNVRIVYRRVNKKKPNICIRPPLPYNDSRNSNLKKNLLTRSVIPDCHDDVFFAQTVCVLAQQTQTTRIIRTPLSR